MKNQKYVYQCDVCFNIIFSHIKATNMGNCPNDDKGIYQFDGEAGYDAAIRNLIDSIENILIGADMKLDENLWLESAVKYAKKVMAQ